MAFTLGDAETELWDNIVDTDSNNRAISSTVADRLINRFYAILKGYADDRVYIESATTAGTTLAGDPTNAFQGDMTAADYRRILRVYPGASAGATSPAGRDLARAERWEIAEMHAEDPRNVDDIGFTYPTDFAVWRAGSASSPGIWHYSVWPRAGASDQHLIVEALKFVTALSGASAKFDMAELDAHTVVDMASAVAARMVGRPEGLIMDIKARIPEQLQAAVAQIEREYGIVRPRPQKEPA